MTRIPPPSEPSTTRRTVGFLALLVMCVGCSMPAAQESQIPSATAPEPTVGPDASPPHSSTEPGTAGLVVRVEGAGEAGRIHLVTVFDDGRVVISGPDGQGGTRAPEERRLTAEGLDLVRAELAAMGLPNESVDYQPVPNPGVEPPGYGGAGLLLEVGLPGGGTAVITWYLFADTERDFFQPQPEAEALDAVAARLASLEDWLPADAWVDGTGGAPTLAFEAPEGILPPNSIVRVVVDQLQLRDEPGQEARVQGTAVRGERFSVAAYFGPVVRDGLEWYRLWPATVGDIDAWAAAGSGADRYLEAVPPSCPSGDPDLATLINMASDWDRLACFGDRSLSFDATFGCGPCDGVIPGEWEPSWLTYPVSVSYLWADFQAGIGPLPMRAPPDFEYPEVGSIVRLTGHYSDPASTTCRISTFVDSELAAVDQRIAELYCREQFVVETMEVIGTDPTYTDPYNP